jgi:hypothetical protein
VSRTERFQIKRYDNLEAMKAEEYAYWRNRPGHERLAATSEISSEAFGLKDAHVHVPRLQRTLVHRISTSSSISAKQAIPAR